MDGVSWQECSKGIENNIEGLLGRMKRMGYKPQAVRRVYIPKNKNKSRPLGLPKGSLKAPLLLLIPAFAGTGLSDPKRY